MDHVDAVLLAVHAGASAFMAGLVWFVQVVHYPLLTRVGRDGYAAYQHEHMRRTTWVVGPVMLLEAATAVLIAIAAVGTPALVRAKAWGGLALLVMVWVVTFAAMVPLHNRLLNGYDTSAGVRLVRWNWVRTGVWTARAFAAAWLIAAWPSVDPPA